MIFKVFLTTIDIYYFKSSVHFIYLFFNLLDKCHSLLCCPQTQSTYYCLWPYFIGPLNSCDNSERYWVRLVFTTSSANFDTWFHWGKWDLKGGGYRSQAALLHIVYLKNPSIALFFLPLTSLFVILVYKYKAILDSTLK